VDICPLLMENQIQHYPWGAKNSQAFIPKLLGIPAVPDLPYAELWMGAHSKAPSMIQMNHEKTGLDQVIQQFPEKMLGKSVYHRFGPTLPFLLKVLSAAQALSIQVHPDKDQAKQLHDQHPEQYPDDNHKPEIAVALDGLTALIGFRPFHQIQLMIEETPELLNFIRPYYDSIFRVDHHPNTARSYFQAMINLAEHESELNQALISLENRLRLKNTECNDHEQLFLELRNIYPSADIGLFALFFLNLIRLKPGQGIFLEAGIPHAYIHGNIIECMANSDNVVRAGLTEKYRDIDTLSKIVRMNQEPIPIIEPEPDQSISIYSTPVSEFQLIRIEQKSGSILQQDTRNKSEILLVISGAFQISWRSRQKNKSRVIQQGQSVFLPAALRLYQLKAIEESLLFQSAIP